MNLLGFENTQMFSWVVLPILIFFSRILDVSIGTIRVILLSRGKKLLPPLLGFFELLIWIVVVAQVMQNLNNFICFIAYAMGFATGTLVGIIIEEKLAIGTLTIRIIVAKDDNKLRESLTKANFGITTVDAYGSNGRVKILYTIIKRKDLKTVEDIIETCISRAFYSIEDTRIVNSGVFPQNGRRYQFINRFKK